jgi:hypothetical protein
VALDRFHGIKFNYTVHSCPDFPTKEVTASAGSKWKHDPLLAVILRNDFKVKLSRKKSESRLRYKTASSNSFFGQYTAHKRTKIIENSQ